MAFCDWNLGASGSAGANPADSSAASSPSSQMPRTVIAHNASASFHNTIRVTTYGPQEYFDPTCLRSPQGAFISAALGDRVLMAVSGADNPWYTATARSPSVNNMARREPASALRVVTPIRRTTLTGATFEKLIAHIVKGDWKAGDRIPPERELCEQLGIARPSLREALMAMELIGMLDRRAGEGTFVRPKSEFLSKPLLWALTGTDHEELQDIIESRVLIEQDLAGLAAERATDEEISAVAGFVQRMESDIEHDRSILDADLGFHLAVADAAHNLVLRNAVQLLRNMTRHWISLKLELPGVPERVLTEHKTILRGLLARDPEVARSAMASHLSSSGRLVMQVAEQR